MGQFGNNFPPRQVERYFQGMPMEEYDEDDVHEYVDKSMATCEEEYK